MVIDILFLIAAFYGFYIGYSRGIIKTFFNVVSLVFGLIIAFRFGPQATELLESAFGTDNPLMFIAGFLLAFVATMVVIRTIANFMEKALESANINFINQVIGGFFSAVIMVLLYSILLWFGDKSSVIKDDAKQESRTYAYLEHFPEQVWEWGGMLKPVFEDFWDHSIEFMDKMEKMSVERDESEPTFYDYEEE